MDTNKKLQYLRVVLTAVGIIFIFGIYPLMHWLWPSGWRWQPNQPEYEQMVLGIYVTLGIFLLIASRNPAQHLSLIWFAALSSIVHGGIMLVQAIVDVTERGHLIGDVPALIIVGIVLAALTPRERDIKR
jgi:predicted membrane channel-forming protein YqfA (hemolysin III family)